MNLRIFFPNFVTSLNLLAGCMAIVAAFNEQLIWTSYFIFIAAALDFIDGLVARLTRGASEIGKQLDSLADMVSFGVAPGMILYQMITIGQKHYFTPLSERPAFVLATASAGLLVTVFAAIRLAKFNIIASDANWFSGMPSPAVAIFFATFPLVMENQIDMNMYYPATEGMMGEMAQGRFHYSSEMILAGLFFSPAFLISCAVIFSVLMVAPVRFFTMKLKSLKWKGNQARYIFLLLSAIILAWFIYEGITYIAFPAILVLYIITSIITHFLHNDDQIQS